MKKGISFLSLLVLAVLLGGCGSGGRFASSFGKRRYMKGHYSNSSQGYPVCKATPVKKSNYNAMVEHPINRIVIAQEHRISLVVSAKQKTDVKTFNHVARTMKPLSSASAKGFIRTMGQTGRPGGGQDYVQPQTRRYISPWLATLLFSLGAVIMAAALVFLTIAIAAAAPPYVIAAFVAILVISVVGVLFVASLPQDPTRVRADAHNFAPLADIFINVFFAILSAAK